MEEGWGRGQRRGEVVGTVRGKMTERKREKYSSIQNGRAKEQEERRIGMISAFKTSGHYEEGKWGKGRSQHRQGLSLGREKIERHCKGRFNERKSRQGEEMMFKGIWMKTIRIVV